MTNGNYSCYPNLPKNVKILKITKITKISKFPNFSKSCQNQTIHATLFFFFSYWPIMSQSLWYSGLRPAPLPPAQPLSLSTTGLNISCVQNSNLFLKWGGGMSKWVLWGRTVLGVMRPVHVPGTCVPRPCSSLCMVTRVLGFAGLVVHLFNGVR